MADRVVLDASAVLEVIYGQPGAERVAPRLRGAALSAVNLAEVLSKAATPDTVELMANSLMQLGVEVHTLDQAAAIALARLYPVTHPRGLSLGDRACLSLGRTLVAEVLTTEHRWGVLARSLRLRIWDVRRDVRYRP